MQDLVYAEIVAVGEALGPSLLGTFSKECLVNERNELARDLFAVVLIGSITKLLLEESFFFSKFLCKNK